MSDYEDFNQTLASILISRVPDTEGHELVRRVWKYCNFYL